VIEESSAMNKIEWMGLSKVQEWIKTTDLISLINKTSDRVVSSLFDKEQEHQHFRHIAKWGSHDK